MHDGAASAFTLISGAGWQPLASHASCRTNPGKSFRFSGSD